jgi:hypothetical protein
VSWADVIKPAGVEDMVRDWVTTDANTGDYPLVDVLLPWHGYFARNNSSAAVSISFPASAGEVVGKAVVSEPVEKLWEVQLVVRCGEYWDAYNYAGVSVEASDGWDRLDYSEPPPPPCSYVSLFFPHREWALYPGDYATDFRAEFVEGQSWDMAVQTDLSPAVVSLSVSGIESIPERFGVYLFDLLIAEVVDLRQKTRYEHVMSASGGERRFQLVVGTQEYVEEIREQLPVIPAEYCLYQNWPNPFNPETEIVYRLPVVAGKIFQPVILKIYNILGQEVRVLVDQAKEPGFHTAMWDGRDACGEELASGVYFYRLTVDGGRWSATKKMVLLR